MKIIRT